jgi:eukaryotic-like serine/threonine-protein kinase
MSFVREAHAEPIPGYRLIEPLGSGGFGEVWKCEAPGGLYKAIKFVFGNLNSLDGDNVRPEQELNALNRVKEVRHPFVLSMDRIEVVEGELVIVMELADRSLHDSYVECQSAGLVGIPRDNLLRYLRDAAEALDHMLQKHHLQHLDIKPRNLFLLSDRVKVADFGLVKQIERQSGQMSSVTPLYAAPELFQGQISEHSDQYSLAIVYCELLTGQRPFNGKTPRQLLLQHTNDEPDLRALPKTERAVVFRALAKDPLKRFPNCLSFVRALHAARSPVVVDSGGNAGNERLQTMAETMEDVYLQNFEPSESESANGTNDKSEAGDDLARIGMTLSLPESGALRPTLVLGVGNFGRLALQDLHCRFMDRFGGLNKLPLVRFLYVDSDPEAVRAAVRELADAGGSPEDVCHLALQPVANYRRRMLEQLNEWLPREKLYALPRSLQTHGSRALGRLAFADNYLRFHGKLRREMQQAVHPDTLFQSVNQTGFALRDNRPRVYVIAAAGGGSSGLLVDLGYTVRRALQEMNGAKPDVVAFLFCGAPEDPATPALEQANVYASLTELNHYADSAVQFTAQYGADGPRTVDQGRPFKHVYLLKIEHRGPECVRNTVAHLGSYLFHELTTPLGLSLERARSIAAASPDATVFRSFGTYSVWFPRGLLLREAGRQACVRLLGDWQSDQDPPCPGEVDAACARLLADPELRPESLRMRIQEQAAATFEDSVSGALTALLSTLEEQAQGPIAMDDSGAWAQQALGRLEEWIGRSRDSESASEWSKSRLGRIFSTCVQNLATEWDQRLSQAAFAMMERPGRRVAAAEAALQKLIAFTGDCASAEEQLLQQQSGSTTQAWQQVRTALESCYTAGGGFSLFGGRTRRQLRVFMDHLAAFGRQRLVEEVAAAGVQFFKLLGSRLSERLRELAFCCQRLRHLQGILETGGDPQLELGDSPLAGENTPAPAPMALITDYWEHLRAFGNTKAVLPNGECDLRDAAERFLEMLTPEHWVQLDQGLQDVVLAPGKGLYQTCVAGGDLCKTLANPFVEVAANSLGELLPMTDVAQVELAGATTPGDDSATHLKSYFDKAAPLLPSASGRHRAFLLIPASDAGTQYGDAARKTISSLEVVRVPGQSDLVFCREQGPLTPEDLSRVFGGCRSAYEKTAHAAPASSHARFDIHDWIPLPV